MPTQQSSNSSSTVVSLIGWLGDSLSNLRAILDTPAQASASDTLVAVTSWTNNALAQFRALRTDPDASVDVVAGVTSWVDEGLDELRSLLAVPTADTLRAPKVWRGIEDLVEGDEADMMERAVAELEATQERLGVSQGGA